MKLFAPLVVGAIAFLSSQVDANGVCYDPNHGTGMDASSVQADMKTIASHGFDSVRTFISKFGNTEMGPIIAAAGLKAMLGMAAAIKAAQAGGVYAVMVGNENLAGATSVPSDMIDVIKQIKSQVPEGVMVCTVQRNTEVIQHETVSGWQDLVNNCDCIGVNAHPYFTAGTTADTAIQVLDNQWQTMVSTYGSKLILTETGWPSAGSLMGNVGSVAGAETFYNAYQQWSSSMSKKFYFQFFDTPYRTEQYEQNFGLVTYDSQDKFSMSVQASVSIELGSNHAADHPGYYPTGTNSQPQQQDNVQQANTQSGEGSSAAPVILAIAAAACVALVAFGFIYQTRKRAAELEVAEGKHDGFSVTPMQNHCAL
ncbi:40S ribosomal protein S4 [Phytophthora nicotianae]|uniref:glucan endo-1,3-beta-D-glucosidase n=1 Tax=Phytophthora nicotianae TaxID=4792 RepID=A0A0W8D680_PHYNI|nr:40S ribosomal protein S4 [Phytophthora nicotianae]